VTDPGQRIGRYRIESVLGRGAMGEVYRATDPVIDRTVAVKTVRLGSQLFEGATEELLARFQQEARSAGQLSHPNIVAIHDYGEEAGLYYLVMECVEGRTLAERFEAGDTWPPDEACALMIQACSALGAAHAKGIVHRDVKPGNLMVDATTGLLKVLDFGVARLDTSDLTQTGTIFGTPSYMSPEQVMGHRVDHRTDLFSLGAVFYEMLAGHKAFEGDHMATIAYRIINEEPSAAAEIPARLGDGYAYVLARALAKDPDERFQSAQELAEAIETYCLGRAAAPSAPRTVARTPTPVASSWGAAGAAPPDAVATPAGAASVGRAGAGRRVWALVAALAAVVTAAGAGAWTYWGGASRRAGLPPPSAAAADSAHPGEAAPAPTGLVLAIEPASAGVTIDDSIGAAGRDTVPLAAGPHRVVAADSGFVEVDTTLAVDAGRLATLALALEPEPPPDPGRGRLDVEANVPGKVYLGGRDVGAAPKRGYEIGAGAYTVRFVPNGAAALATERRVSVAADQTQRVEFRVTESLLTVAVRSPRWATVYINGSRAGDTPLIDRRLPARSYEIRVHREGYRPAERLVRLTPGQHVQWVDIELAPTSGGME